MLVPPLLSPSLSASITSLLEKKQADEIMTLLTDLPLEEKVHYLRYFYHQSPDEHVPCIFTVWQACMPLDHLLNPEQSRHAFYTAGMWWDVLEENDQRRNSAYDILEGMLEVLGATDEGRSDLCSVRKPLRQAPEPSRSTSRPLPASTLEYDEAPMLP